MPSLMISRRLRSSRGLTSSREGPGIGGDDSSKRTPRGSLSQLLPRFDFFFFSDEKLLLLFLLLPFFFFSFYTPVLWFLSFYIYIYISILFPLYSLVY